MKNEIKSKGVDYCASANHVCHARAQCINLQTTYACHCSPGYTGDGKECSDINECETVDGPGGHRCGANTVCVNSAGSYRCDCLPGYIHPSPAVNDTCIEYDECAAGVDDCHPTLATCINTPGGYQCQCRPGYQGNGFECQPVCDRPCQNGGQCIAPNQCSCRRGFKGTNCELDVDECETGIDQCDPNSDCRNMPGWYACVCKPGFRSPHQETLLGTLCKDIDECAEGSHSCHGNTQCLNTIGSYECSCPVSNPNCSLVCTTAEGVHQSGESWISNESPCVSCHCREGVVTCSKLPCHCTSSSSSSSSVESTAKSGLNHNRTLVHHPNSEQCCPQCRPNPSSKSECSHQEFPGLTFDSGQRWIYQCQSCECLHGETDCWPMECPPVYCSHPVRSPGDCCLRCPESDPCSAVEEMSSLIDKEPVGCHYQGLNHTHSAEWAAGLDGCTHCKCKNGKVCCQFDTRCAQRRLVVGVQHLVRQGHVRRIHRGSPEGFLPSTETEEVWKKGNISRMGTKTSSTTETATRSSSRTTTSQWRRLSRAARLARSSEAVNKEPIALMKERQEANQSRPSSSPSSTTEHKVLTKSQLVPVVEANQVVSQHQESGPT